MSEPGPAILYKLGNLIKFYQGTIGSVHLLQLMAHSILGVLPAVSFVPVQGFSVHRWYGCCVFADATTSSLFLDVQEYFAIRSCSHVHFG